MLSKPGSRPMAKVDTPISIRLSTSSFLRPIRSPKWPKTMPPTGRAMKPTANVANDFRVPSGSPGKNTVGNTTAAATP